MKKSRFSEEQIIGVLKEAEAGRKIRDLCRAHGIKNHMITDKGQQFVAKTLRRWCRRRKIRHRFGAVGRYGSIAVVERLIRTLKTECSRRLIVVPLRQIAFERELAYWRAWHNADRPHEWLGARTPDEVY